MMNSEDDILNILKYLNLTLMYTNKILKPSFNKSSKHLCCNTVYNILAHGFSAIPLKGLFHNPANRQVGSEIQKH